MFDYDDYDDDYPSNEDMFWLLEPDEDEEEEPMPWTPKPTNRDWIIAILFWIVVCVVGGFFVILGGV